MEISIFEKAFKQKCIFNLFSLFCSSTLLSLAYEMGYFIFMDFTDEELYKIRSIVDDELSKWTIVNKKNKTSRIASTDESVSRFIDNAKSLADKNAISLTDCLKSYEIFELEKIYIKIADSIDNENILRQENEFLIRNVTREISEKIKDVRPILETLNRNFVLQINWQYDLITKFKNKKYMANIKILLISAILIFFIFCILLIFK